MTKLDVRVERARRLPPAQRDVKAKLRRECVADEKRVAVEAVRRERAELVLPLADNSAGPHFDCNEAERR